MAHRNPYVVSGNEALMRYVEFFGLNPEHFTEAHWRFFRHVWHWRNEGQFCATYFVMKAFQGKGNLPFIEFRKMADYFGTQCKDGVTYRLFEIDLTTTHKKKSRRDKKVWIKLLPEFYRLFGLPIPKQKNLLTK